VTYWRDYGSDYVRPSTWRARRWARGYSTRS
jgi:hypothetical protein